MKNYHRVIPRDLFNEAKLLNCFGMLALKVLDNMIPEHLDIVISEVGQPFWVELTDDGSLFIQNYPVMVNNVFIRFKTTYNSKSKYPFYCEIDYEDIEVFNEDGTFTEEFSNIYKHPIFNGTENRRAD